MKYRDNNDKIKVAVVGCLHGDELIGQAVFDHLAPRLKRYPGLRLILANEQAMTRSVRFIDDDLNRSFPGNANGHHEHRLAAQLLPVVTGAQYVLDLHTTTTDVKMTPIVANLNPATRRILNLTASREIALMEPPIPDHALIGHVAAGVSLELNRQYAATPLAQNEITDLIESLLTGRTEPPQKRTIYHVTGTIPQATKLPASAANFKFVPALGLYPFLLGENAYTTHQGFAATRTSTATI